MDDINDEVEAIEAIYCGKNEFVMQSKGMEVRILFVIM